MIRLGYLLAGMILSISGIAIGAAVYPYYPPPSQTYATSAGTDTAHGTIGAGALNLTQSGTQPDFGALCGVGFGVNLNCFSWNYMVEPTTFLQSLCLVMQADNGTLAPTPTVCFANTGGVPGTPLNPDAIVWHFSGGFSSFSFEDFNLTDDGTANNNCAVNAGSCVPAVFVSTQNVANHNAAAKIEVQSAAHQCNLQIVDSGPLTAGFGNPFAAGGPGSPANTADLQCQGVPLYIGGTHVYFFAASDGSNTIVGDNTSGTNITNVVGGNAANTRANNSPILTLASGGNITVAPTIAGNAITTANQMPLSGTSGSIGGGALVAGACASGTVTVTGATTSMVALANPNTYPGDGAEWEAYVSSVNTVTVKVCAIVALTPTASTYNVRVIQ